SRRAVLHKFRPARRRAAKLDHFSTRSLRCAALLHTAAFRLSRRKRECASPRSARRSAHSRTPFAGIGGSRSRPLRVELRRKTIHEQMYRIKCVDPAPGKKRNRCTIELQFPADFSVAFAQITAYQGDLWQLTDPLHGLDKRLFLVLRQFRQITT